MPLQVKGAVEGMKATVVGVVADVASEAATSSNSRTAGSTVVATLAAVVATPTVCAHRPGRSRSSISATVRATTTRELVAVVPMPPTLGWQRWVGKRN